MNAGAINTLYGAGYFLVIVVPILALNLLFRVRRRHWAKRAHAITGIADRIDEYVDFFAGHGFPKRYRAIIRFQVLHEMYSVKSRLSFSAEETVWKVYPEGGKVEVLYDPTHPKRARINTPKELYGNYNRNIFICLLLSGIYLLITTVSLIYFLSGHH